MTSDNHGMRI